MIEAVLVARLACTADGQTDEMWHEAVAPRAVLTDGADTQRNGSCDAAITAVRHVGS